jgi:hypothetical protein
MSGSALNSIKLFNADEIFEDPIHISQFLTRESVGTVLNRIAQIKADQDVLGIKICIDGFHQFRYKALFILYINLKSKFISENIYNINTLLFIQCFLSR